MSKIVKGKKHIELGRKNGVDFRKEYSSDSKKRSLIFSNEVPLFAIFT